MNRFQQIRDLQAKIKAEISAIGRDGIKEFFDPIFAANPALKAVKWTQYTPYFNDGEPCVFSVNDPYVLLDGVAEDAGDYGDGYLASFELKHYDRESPERKARLDALPQLNWDFELPDSAILEQIFGDHTEITVNRDGTVTQEDHEHD
jgi:hypothetical protein